MKKCLLLLLAILLLAGCAAQEAPVPDAVQTEAVVQNEGLTKWERELARLAEQSDAIKYSLEHDPLNQMEMNQKARELYDLWDDALNRLWTDLETGLPEGVFDVLLQDQLTWIADKEAAMEAAGQMYEGGSIYPLIIYSEGAQITQERVYALFELLK